ncbi:MAG: flavin reductase family protein [Desulfarculaceae bacterium]|nr:flavin reductase family protein [Desulfarculaceae bacterium]MCF8073225.1 flavin reductase family protein [Desulfarculaceae bacterium]MCF8100821.1 flavin reductase family protein [Desulfarculaceae bacterium]MCF8117741.1 flavin reductase family protein [Desulfarculaceae bacterium]
MEFEPREREMATVLPVVLVSTLDQAGVRNLAPYSNYTPVLRITDLIMLASWHRRDTLKNIRHNQEFVVSVPGVDLADKIMPTAMHYPPSVDEFEKAGLKARPSAMVAPPGVEGCLAWLECRLHKQYVEKNYVLVVGQVLRLEVRDDLVNQRGGMDLAKAQPLLASLDREGMRWATARDLGKGEPYGAMFPNGQDPMAQRKQSQDS